MSSFRGVVPGRRAILGVLLLGSVSGTAVQGPVIEAAAPREQVVDLSPAFGGFRAAAFVMRDVTAGTTVRHGPELARTRLSPCSTFKIPNSLIGLETGVIADASSVLPWDGQRREIEAWNRDHDLRSAIRDSAVPYYQELARRVGPQRMREWVRRLEYGNRDVSGAIDSFWLGDTLRISPDEQVEFLGRLHSGALPVSARSLAIVKDVLVQPVAAPGLVYRGKTGSCSAADGAPAHGWWVGSLERRGRLVVFAALIQGEGATGRVCRPLAEAALRRLGALPAPSR